MKGDKVVEDWKERWNTFLLNAGRKTYRTFQGVLSGYFHIILCTLIDQWMHIVIHSCVLLKIHLNEVRKSIFLRMINGIQSWNNAWFSFVCLDYSIRIRVKRRLCIYYITRLNDTVIWYWCTSERTTLKLNLINYSIVAWNGQNIRLTIYVASVLFGGNSKVIF